MAAWLALQCSKPAVTALLRITWRTVGSIITRVSDEIDASVDRLDGLKRTGIDKATLDHGLSQGLVESTNTKSRVLTRIAYGFHSADALIALAMLSLGGHRPSLPGRSQDPRIRQENRISSVGTTTSTVTAASP